MIEIKVLENGVEIASAVLKKPWGVFRVGGALWRVGHVTEDKGGVWERVTWMLLRAMVSPRTEQEVWAARLKKQDSPSPGDTT